MKKLLLLAGIISLLSASSCATIVSGSRQNVKFESNPSNATVFIDEVEVGKTPFEMKLQRNREYDVAIKLDGYKPFSTSLTKKFNAWYIGNIFFGGVIGLVIDPITGAIYRLSPNEVKSINQKVTTAKSTANKVNLSVSLDTEN